MPRYDVEGYLGRRLSSLRQQDLSPETREVFVVDFFLIARLIRARFPLRPTLPDLLARLRADGLYSLRRFPGEDYPGRRYVVLTRAFDLGGLLYQSAYAYRAGDVVRSGGRRPSSATSA